MRSLRGLALAAGLSCGLASCLARIVPLVIEGRLDARAFDLVCDQVRLRYGPLDIADESEFRVQSGWANTNERGRVMRRRATLFREAPGRLAIVVEESLLTGNLLGEPHWTTPQPVARLERELAAMIDAVLGP